MNGGRREEVILVHGLWFGAWALAPLARRLRSHGFQTRRHSYRTKSGSLDDHAAGLRAFAQSSTADRLHFVAHSLGGLVVLRMLAERDNFPPGRIVLLGTPLRGSRIAQRVRSWPVSGLLTGTVGPDLVRGFDRIPPGRETGMIAGSRSFGLGLLAGGLGAPGDGTVALEETQSDALADRLVLPLTHTGLVYSSQVAEATARFLRSGRFLSTGTV